MGGEIKLRKHDMKVSQEAAPGGKGPMPNMKKHMKHEKKHAKHMKAKGGHK